MDFFTLSATSVHTKVDLPLIWAQVARCVNLPRVQTLQLWLDKNSICSCRYTANTKLHLHGRNGAVFVDIYTYMFLDIYFDYVHRWNAQLAELTAQRTWLDLHKSSATNRFTVFRLSSEKFSIYRYLTEIVRSAPVVKFA